MCAMALDLIHATRTGQFPYPGDLHAQPQRLQRWYRGVLATSIAADRVSGMGGMGSMLGGSGASEDDQERGGGSGSSKVAPPPSRRTKNRRIVGPSRDKDGA